MASSGSLGTRPGSPLTRRHGTRSRTARRSGTRPWSEREKNDLHRTFQLALWSKTHINSWSRWKAIKRLRYLCWLRSALASYRVVMVALGLEPKRGWCGEISSNSNCSSRMSLNRMLVPVQQRKHEQHLLRNRSLREGNGADKITKIGAHFWGHRKDYSFLWQAKNLAPILFFRHRGRNTKCTCLPT